ncbi:MAG: DUF11 domain-containing protein [Planctomycetia bacterium]|nr:DUF11 domain-containing protein [Planctomycetia bacterium]
MFVSRTTRSCTTTALLLVASVALSAGCAKHTSHIDPTGKRIFTTDTPYHQRPGPPSKHDTTAVMVTPAKIIAPVGSEVVVQAAVCGEGKALIANEPVEWSIAPNSVGYFVQAGETGPLEWLHHVGRTTRKIDNTFAVSSTSPKFIMLNRGTPESTDDVPVLRGQAWVTMSSPTEGTSFVSAVAPSVRGWNAHKQTATVYWVDCQWTFPPPAINPAGSRHTFTTMLVKHSNHCPLAGYRVRYEIAGGPPAGFAPSGSQIIEVTTNALGQAPVEIFQQQPGAGTNTVNIQVIRPADWPGGDGTQLAVGTGSTQMTWSTTASGLSIDKSGPAEVAVGGTVTYRIDVRNPSDLSARLLTVTDAIPNTLTLIGSNPPALVTGSTVTWQLGDLPAGQSRSLELSFRTSQAGIINNCATVRSADGVSAQDCAATTVTSPSVEITMVAPQQAAVGEDITFVTTVTNRGSTKATGIVLIDRFDDGLKHEFAASPIENRELGDLAPGESRKVNVRLKAVQPGRWCNTMELTGNNGNRGSAQACVTAVAATVQAVPPVVTPPPSAPSTATLPQLTVRKTVATTRAMVGDAVMFTIEIANVGQTTATNVRLDDTYDLGIAPMQATDGWKSNGNNLFWTLPTLAPGQAFRYQVESVAQAAGQRICNRATLICQEGARADSEACLEITARQTTLALNIEDERDPRPVGEEQIYDVRVRNLGNVPDRQVAVSVLLPEQMTPSAGHQGPTPFSVEGRIIRFQPIAELRPGEEQIFKVHGIARQPGTATAQATVVSQLQPTPITATTSTTQF